MIRWEEQNLHRRAAVKENVHMDTLIEKAVLVGVQLQKDTHFDYEMDELKNLAEACNVEVLGEITQNLERINPSHYVGKGKVDELKAFYEETEANLIIFNDELSPSQSGISRKIWNARSSTAPC